MFNKVERLISLRNLRPQKKEGFLKIISAFSFLGIMLGVSILIIVMSVMNGFRTDLTNKIIGLNPHIVIESYGSNINKELSNRLENNYQNFNITKSYNGEGIIMVNEAIKGVLVKGVSINKHKGINFIKKNLVKGNFDKFKANTILIGNELAFDLGLNIGDKINITSSAFVKTPVGSIPKQDNYLIAGIFNSGFFEYDQNVVFLNIADSLYLFDKEEKDLSLEIYLDNPIKADFYKNKIQQENEDLAKFYIYSWTDLNKSFFSALKIERNVMFIILTLIIIVAAFNIISGLTILIKNKTKEIAILKTLGLSSKSIKKSFFLTGMTIGFFATLAGIFLGVLFSLYIENIRIFFSRLFNLEIFPSEIYFLEKMPSEINIYSIFMIFTFSLLITALASYFPANKISKMETTKALKYE